MMCDLLAKLESATEGSRELDAEIAYRITESLPGITMHPDSVPGADVFAFWQDGICHNCSRWEPFTTSLDAALTLVPEGRARRTVYAPRGTWPYRVWIYRDYFVPFEDDEGRPALGKTEPLALCIAALKARA